MVGLREASYYPESGHGEEKDNQRDVDLTENEVDRKVRGGQCSDGPDNDQIEPRCWTCVGLAP